jgi:magnesium-transporting ATPase (P-type)
MQLLWINVFLDLAAVIAITTGFPIDSLMKTPPYNIKDKILTDEMKFEIVYLATY